MSRKQLKRTIEKGQDKMRIVLIGSLAKKKECISSLRLIKQVDTLAFDKKQILANKLKKKMKKISKFHRVSEQILDKLNQMRQSLRKKHSKQVEKTRAIQKSSIQAEERADQEKELKIQDLIEQMSEQINLVHMIQMGEQSQNYFSRFEQEQMGEDPSQKSSQNELIQNKM